MPVHTPTRWIFACGSVISFIGRLRLYVFKVKRREEAIPFRACLTNFWRASSPKKYHPLIDQVVIKFGL